MKGCSACRVSWTQERKLRLAIGDGEPEIPDKISPLLLSVVVESWQGIDHTDGFGGLNLTPGSAAKNNALLSHIQRRFRSLRTDLNRNQH